MQRNCFGSIECSGSMHGCLDKWRPSKSLVEKSEPFAKSPNISLVGIALLFGMRRILSRTVPCQINNFLGCALLGLAIQAF